MGVTLTSAMRAQVKDIDLHYRDVLGLGEDLGRKGCLEGIGGPGAVRTSGGHGWLRAGHASACSVPRVVVVIFKTNAPDVLEGFGRESA
jgi:hypothetical protein